MTEIILFLLLNQTFMSRKTTFVFYKMSEKYIFRNITGNRKLSQNIIIEY